MLEQFDFIDSKFRYAILAAKRAKQIINGSKKKVELKAENPLTVALEEIAQGKVDFEILSQEYLQEDQLTIDEESLEDNGEEETLLQEEE